MMVASVSWAQSVTKTVDLTFGKFVAGSGGSVVISPAGVRSATGGVVLVPSGAGAAAQFSVSKTGGNTKTYTITLPADGVVSLVSGANSTAVNTFTSSPSANITLAGTTEQTIFVGATLTVGSNQPSGSRSGSVCLNNFPRTISEALGVHNSAELSTVADGACDVPADAVGNSGRTNKFHSMRPLPILAGSHSRPHPAFDSPGWSVAVACCTNQCGVRSGSVHPPRWHRHVCTHART